MNIKLQYCMPRFIIKLIKILMFIILINGTNYVLAGENFKLFEIDEEMVFDANNRAQMNLLFAYPSSFAEKPDATYLLDGFSDRLDLGGRDLVTVGGIIALPNLYQREFRLGRSDSYSLTLHSGVVAGFTSTSLNNDPLDKWIFGGITTALSTAIIDGESLAGKPINWTLSLGGTYIESEHKFKPYVSIGLSFAFSDPKNLFAEKTSDNWSNISDIHIPNPSTFALLIIGLIAFWIYAFNVNLSSSQLFTTRICGLLIGLGRSSLLSSKEMNLHVGQIKRPFLKLHLCMR